MKPELSVVFESKLVLRFSLPGTRYTSSQSMGGSTQLQISNAYPGAAAGEHQEWYRLETTAENALETVRVLRELASEIERVARSAR